MSISTYKSDVFSMLASIPEYALNIYNAINQTKYTDPSLIEISHLENGFSLSIRNDASFIFDNRFLNIYEHQSTYNPNMPLRELIYFVHLIESTIRDIRKKLFTSTKVSIPTPNFVVLYNGIDERPDVEKMKLSDCFIQPTDSPQLEVICTVYNINPGHNQELLNNSDVLSGYTIFVETVRNNLKNHPLENSIDLAIDHCIEHDILREFFTNNRDEIKGATMLDYTFETQIANYEEDLSEAHALIQTLTEKNQQQSKEIQQQKAMIQAQKDSINTLLAWAKEHGFDDSSINAD